MGAVRMRIQTADKNITIIHTTPVHSLYIAFFSEKVILSQLGEKYALIYKRKVQF